MIRGRNVGRGRARCLKWMAECSSKSSEGPACTSLDTDCTIRTRIGRGRGRRFLDDSSENTDDYFPESTVADLADRFRDDHVLNTTETGTSEILSSDPKEVVIPKLNVPKNIFDEAGIANGKILSVDFAQRVVIVEFVEANMTVECKPHLQVTSGMHRWMEENRLILNSATLVESVMLSSLEFYENTKFIMYQVHRHSSEQKFLDISIDMFKEAKLKNDFMMCLTYATLPRMPQVKAHAIGVVTNLRDKGEVDIVFYDEVLLGLRETLRALQKNKKLLAPRCPVIQECFKELIEGFGVKFFLAPLHEDWTDLYRVQVVGFVFDNDVKVVYVDLGKCMPIPLSNLVIPLAASFVPELLYTIPPKAVTVQVDKLDSSVLETLKSMQIEGRICYIQTVDESGATPVVNIFLSNELVGGAVSLSDLANSYSTKREVFKNVNYKAQTLKTLSKKLENLTKEWQESVMEESGSIQPTGFAACECCIGI